MIVLDTHTWIWWVSAPDRLGKNAGPALRAADRIGIPAICCWEVAMLVSHGRISLDHETADWMEQALAHPRVELLSLTPRIAAKSMQLGNPALKDPRDRLIVATALLHSAPLVTKDEIMRSYPAVSTIW